MIFEWDDEKAELNESKHGVRFDEAVTVFKDLFFVDFYDPKGIPLTSTGSSLSANPTKGDY